MVSEKEVEVAREAWREYWSGVIGQHEDNKSPMEGMRRALEAAARVRAESNAEPVAWRYKLFESDPEWTVTTEKPQGVVVEPLFTRPSEQAVTEADEKLPCDVQLPGVKLKRGARLSTLLMAIRKRKDWPEEQTKLPRMPVAARPTPQPSVKVKPLEWVASDDWEYRWTADLYAIEDQGKNWSKDRYWLYYNGQRLGKFGTLDTALFTAQADYDRRILSALTAGKPEQHPDDEAVDRFAAAMKAKLKWEREERGRYGWNDPEVCSEEYLAKLLIEHLAKGNEGNFEDIANFCMMLHQRGAHPRVLADALTAGKPEQAVVSGTVGVKPLKWDEHPAGGQQAIAAGLGLYRVHANGDDWYLVPDHMGKGGKAAAQADYERRILSALTAGKPEPASGTDYFGSLVERARASATKASAKFPQPNYVTLKIAEEAGEVIRGAVHYAERRMEWSEVEGEIIQLLAMLIRFVTEGDQVNRIVPPTLPTAGGGE